MVIQYPKLPGLTYSKIRRPKHNVSVQTHQSGGEVRMSYWSAPLWEWDLTYSLLRDGQYKGRAWDELKQIEGLFLASTGSLSGFQFRDVDDYTAFRTGVGTSDGTTTAFTLSRYRGAVAEGPGYLGKETIGFLDTLQPFNLYVDGGPDAIDVSDPVYGYTLNTATPKKQQVVFNSAPPAGHVFDCDMSWNFYARFQTDSLDFEKFSHSLWGLKKVTLCSLRF